MFDNLDKTPLNHTPIPQENQLKELHFEKEVARHKNCLQELESGSDTI
jgi:hypothetical protein